MALVVHDLGEDLLEHVLLLLDPASLARLSGTGEIFRSSLRPLSAPFLRRLLLARGFGDVSSSAFPLPASFADSFEALAVMEAMRAIADAKPRPNHVVFQLGSLSIVGSSKRTLDRYAALMLRHPRLLMRVDSHTGVGAPPRIAPQHSISSSRSSACAASHERSRWRAAPDLAACRSRSINAAASGALRFASLAREVRSGWSSEAAVGAEAAH